VYKKGRKRRDPEVTKVLEEEKRKQDLWYEQ